jgi:hypothetical protein
MDRVNQVVFAVDVIHVDIIVVTPVGRPVLDKLKPVAARVEAAVIATLDLEVVFAAEVGTEVFVADPADVAVASIALGLLRSAALIALDSLRALLRGFILLGPVSFGLLLLFGSVFLLLFRLLPFGLLSALAILLLLVFLPFLLGAVWFTSVSLLLFWLLLSGFLRSGLVSFLFAIGFLFPFFLLGRLLFLPIGLLAIDRQAGDQDEHCRAGCQSHDFSLHRSLPCTHFRSVALVFMLGGTPFTDRGDSDELQRGEKLRRPA